MAHLKGIKRLIPAPRTSAGATILKHRPAANSLGLEVGLSRKSTLHCASTLRTEANNGLMRRPSGLLEYWADYYSDRPWTGLNTIHLQYLATLSRAFVHCISSKRLTFQQAEPNQNNLFQRFEVDRVVDSMPIQQRLGSSMPSFDHLLCSLEHLGWD